MPYNCEPPLSLAFISTNNPFHILFLLFLFLVLLLQNMIVYMRITVHSYHPPPFLDLPCPKLRIRGHSRNPLASSFSRIDLPFFSNNSRPVGFVDTTFSFTFISSSNLAFQAANDSGVTGVPQFFGCSCISTFACSSAFYGESTPMQRPRRQRHPQPPSQLPFPEQLNSTMSGWTRRFILIYRPPGRAGYGNRGDASRLYGRL